jgi:hypothetical protein
MIEMTNEDKDLQDIFHGEEKPMHPETVHITLGQPTAKAETKKQATPAKNMPKEEKPVDAQWEPVKPTPNYMDKLRTTAKDVCLYAVLSVILFWWQQTGRLEVTTSWYALLVCVGMVFFTIGRAWSGAVK